MSHSVSKKLTLASLVAMTLAIPVEAALGSNVFIKFDGVEGEALDDKHKKWIDVLSWSWGMSTDNRGNACVEGLSITKHTDYATDDLVQAIPAGEVFESVLLDGPIGGSGSSRYLNLEMTSVKVTSFTIESESGGEPPTENINIDFQELKGFYKTTDTTGAPLPVQEFVIPGIKCK